MTKSTLPANFVSAITTDVKVGMDEVVSMFVAKYEDGLFAKKDSLQAKIRVAKAALTDLDKMLIGSVDKSTYHVEVPQLGFTFKAGEVSVNWGEGYRKEKNSIVVELKMFDKSDKDSHGVYTKHMFVPISQVDIDERQRLNSEVEQSTTELTEVMGLIKSVSRKERQIKGKISEMKMEQAGFRDVMDNPDLQKLIQLN